MFMRRERAIASRVQTYGWREVRKLKFERRENLKR